MANHNTNAIRCILGTEMAKAYEMEKERLREPPLAETAFPQRAYDFWRGELDLIDPALSSLDDELGGICRAFTTIQDSPRRAAVRRSIGMEEFYTLMAFARREAVFAMRTQSLQLVALGFAAVSMIEEERVDWRDILVCIALLCHAAVRVSSAPDALIKATADISDSRIAARLIDFINQPPSYRDIRASWGFDEIESQNGPGFVMWGAAKYSPSVDMKPLAIDLSAMITDKYQRESVVVATRFPSIWLSKQENRDLSCIIDRSRGAVAITGDLFPNQCATHDCQRLFVFSMQASTDDDTKALLKMSLEKRGISNATVAVARGSCFGLAVGRSVVDGVEPFETAESISRYYEPLTKVLSSYTEK